MIGVDLTYFDIGECKQGEVRQGIALVAVELLDAFARMGLQDHFCLISNSSQAEYIKTRFPGFSQCVIPCRLCELVYHVTKGQKTLQRFRKYMSGPKFLRAINHNQFSCIWYPYTAVNITTISKKTPAVFTIHDLIPYHQEETQEKWDAHYRLISRCEKIVTISDFVRQDVVDTFGCFEKMAGVIPNSIDLHLKARAGLEVTEKKYILCINAYVPHKNTITLLKAYAKIADKTDLDLVCCGGRKDNLYWNLLNQYILEKGLQERVHLYLAIPEEQKNWLLENAALFVTPSMNEGFGRTPVEAAICRVPVISTKAASLVEATQGLAHYYENPEDEEDLARIIMEYIENPDSPEALDRISKQLSEAYAPETCAKKYWEIFQEYEKV